jgi:hypothetical protein
MVGALKPVWADYAFVAEMAKAKVSDTNSANSIKPPDNAILLLCHFATISNRLCP